MLLFYTCFYICYLFFCQLCHASLLHAGCHSPVIQSTSLVIQSMIPSCLVSHSTVAFRSSCRPLPALQMRVFPFITPFIHLFLYNDPSLKINRSSHYFHFIPQCFFHYLLLFRLLLLYSVLFLFWLSLFVLSDRNSHL